MISNGQKIANLAFKEVGVTENPRNSNKNKYGKWFGLDGVAWCAIFISWCYAQAGFALENIGFKNGMAGCKTAAKHFWETGQVIDKENIQVGDLVFFDWNGDGRFDHVGLFNGWKNKNLGIFYTIEGNTSLNNQSNGGEVMSRNRDLNKVKCIFVHPKVLN